MAGQNSQMGDTQGGGQSAPNYMGRVNPTFGGGANLMQMIQGYFGNQGVGTAGRASFDNPWSQQQAPTQKPIFGSGLGDALAAKGVPDQNTINQPQQWGNSPSLAAYMGGNRGGIGNAMWTAPQGGMSRGLGGGSK